MHGCSVQLWWFNVIYDGYVLQHNLVVAAVAPSIAAFVELLEERSTAILGTSVQSKKVCSL